MTLSPQDIDDLRDAETKGSPISDDLIRRLAQLAGIVDEDQVIRDFEDAREIAKHAGIGGVMGRDTFI